jgi:hypothetical protein
VNFPTKSVGPKDEQFEFIVADVFLRRFIIELPSANLVFIALEADVFFWVAGEIDCRCNLGAAVFRLFGNADAAVCATKHVGHRVQCPACACVAVVTGDPITAPKKTIDGDIITEKQEHLPNKFECVACGMKIAGLSQLTAAGLGDVYVQAQSYNANEFYSSSPEDAYGGYEEDNNEF